MGMVGFISLILQVRKLGCTKSGSMSEVHSWVSNQRQRPEKAPALPRTVLSRTHWGRWMLKPQTHAPYPLETTLPSSTLLFSRILFLSFAFPS